MLARIHSEPSSVWRGLHDDMENFLSLAANRSDAVRQWVPNVDVIEEDNAYVLRADVPGIDPKNIEVLFEENVLTLKGEREDKQDTESDGYRRIERVHGSFQRSFRLPDSIDVEKIAAQSNHGVLEVHVPKKEKAQRRIEIQA